MLTGVGVSDGPRKVNLLHLVPSVVDSTFTISERLLQHLLAMLHAVKLMCSFAVFVCIFCS